MDYRKQIEELDSKIKSLNEKRRKFLDDWVKTFGVKIGDEVEITGYSHSKKRMKISRLFIRESYFGEKYQVVTAIGSVLKKDGTIGKNEADSTYKID